MFSKALLKDVAGEQLDLYMDWLLQEVYRCELQADNCLQQVRSDVFHNIKNRMLQQELKRHSRELRRVLDEKKRRLPVWCH